MDDRLWISDQGDGTYTNAVLFADYSDPDVIRVGNTFYMTASSFNYTPGLPILISHDLVNWKLVNYALRNIPEDRYGIPRHSEGVWAPAIRYHQGKFYIYYGMPDEGIFMVCAEDPLGQWEEPVCVLPGKGLIDPCPYWEEDGSAVIVHGYAKSRIGFKSFLGIFPVSSDGKKATGEDHILYDGLATNPTIEGPKVYFRSGYYYIFAPAGGVVWGWQTVLRSKSIYGPFEERVVLAQGDTVINGPHQGALVDTCDGRQWFVHFQDRGLYGRITHTQPVVWEGDWPVIGERPEDGCGKPVLRHAMPAAGEGIPTDPGDPYYVKTPSYLEASDDFGEAKLGLQWQWLGNHRPEFYSLQENPGKLRLYALNPTGEEGAILWRESNVLTQKLVCPYFRAQVSAEAAGLQEGESAGMIMMGGLYTYLALRREKDGFTLVEGRAVETRGKDAPREEVHALRRLTSEEAAGFIFTMSLENTEPGKEPFGTGRPVFSMGYILQGQEEKVPTDFMPADHTWVGAKLGIFAHSPVAALSAGPAGFADFGKFTVTPLS